MSRGYTGSAAGTGGLACARGRLSRQLSWGRAGPSEEWAALSPGGRAPPGDGKSRPAQCGGVPASRLSFPAAFSRAAPAEGPGTVQEGGGASGGEAEGRGGRGDGEAAQRQACGAGVQQEEATSAGPCHLWDSPEGRPCAP